MKMFFDVAISLDGFIAGSNGGAENPLGDRGMELHTWMFKQKAFLEHLNLGPGGELGPDNDLLQETFDRIGANIMGKNMFIEGEANWPENAPFHCPVYVLTHEKREPWERPGGTTFYFINDGIESALKKAKTSAGNKDIRISGGARCIQQFMNAGLVDQFILHHTPVLLGKGVRLFDGVDETRFKFEVTEVISSSLTTHIKYQVKK